MGFSVCVSSEAATCPSLSSLLPSLRPSRPRLIPSTATTEQECSHTPTGMPMASPTLVFPSVLPLVWTPSPRELFPLPTTTARGPLMLRLTPTTLVATPTVFLSVIPLARTPSPRALMPPPRDMLLTPTATSDTDTLATSDTTTARGPPTPTTLVVMPSLTLPTVSLPPLCPSDPPPVWTPSPRALTPPPRDTFPTPMATSVTTTVKS